MESTINFTTDDGQEVSFNIIEEARLGGETYLLVSAQEDGDDEVGYVLKQVESEDKTQKSYVMVTDDSELEAVTGLFDEVLGSEMDVIVEEEHKN